MNQFNDKSSQQSRPFIRLAWVEYTKAFAFFLIFMVHFTERVMGGAYFANPSASWPSLEQRFAQLLPIQHDGISPIILNIWRYIGWSGDAGVQLFLIISGFGLVWGILHRQGATGISLKWFYSKRLLRIYPLWWGVHIVTYLLSFFSLVGIPLGLGFWASFLGIRSLPRLFFYISPAWWYIGLLLQLYFVFPFLWKLLQRLEAKKAFLLVAVIAFLVRGVGLFILDTYSPGLLLYWSYGAFFITRLPEFFFGMCFAWYLYHNSQQIEAFVRHRFTVLLLAVIIYVTGMILSFFLWGMTFALFLLGLGLFIPIYVIFHNKPASDKFDLGIWLGRHSYALYLTHHIIIDYIISPSLDEPSQLLPQFIIAIILTVISSIFLEWCTNAVTKHITHWYREYGWRGTGLRFAGSILIILTLFLIPEHIVRQLDPQGPFGWAERTSLEPHPDFGWRLIPNKTTRLRWETYDYMVTSNSLGFPGPEYSEEKPPNTLRIMVVGDAFSSAEGVDTNDAWPRLMEDILRTKSDGKNVEVLNFAITGYGPQHDAAILSTYSPIYDPDIIIVQMFVNDFDDVMKSNEQFTSQIFAFPEEDSIVGFLDPRHLKKYININIITPLMNRDYPGGNFFGYTYAIRVEQDNYEEKQQRVKLHLEEIRDIANEIDSKLVVVLVPGASQVCLPEDLPYFPSNIDLSDTSTFDMDLPQRTIGSITSDLNIDFYDLRKPLKEAPSCPYQPYNLHWLELGHEVVAEYIAEIIGTQEYD